MKLTQYKANKLVNLAAIETVKQHPATISPASGFARIVTAPIPAPKSAI